LVMPVRLERTTCCLEGSCSIQLSYGTGIHNKKFDLKLAVTQ
jgi:hypothetical protein